MGAQIAIELENYMIISRISHCLTSHNVLASMNKSRVLDYS